MALLSVARGAAGPGSVNGTISAGPDKPPVTCSARKLAEWTTRPT